MIRHVLNFKWCCGAPQNWLSFRFRANWGRGLFSKRSFYLRNIFITQNFGQRQQSSETDYPHGVNFAKLFHKKLSSPFEWSFVDINVNLFMHITLKALRLKTPLQCYFQTSGPKFGNNKSCWELFAYFKKRSNYPSKLIESVKQGCKEKFSNYLRSFSEFMLKHLLSARNLVRREKHPEWNIFTTISTRPTHFIRWNKSKNPAGRSKINQAKTMGVN